MLLGLHLPHVYVSATTCRLPASQTNKTQKLFGKCLMGVHGFRGSNPRPTQVGPLIENLLPSISKAMKLKANAWQMPVELHG